MAKASLWKAPIFGWVLNRTGSIPIYKNPRMNAGLGKHLKKRLDSHYNITVFPEGHRSDDGHMFKFQNGIFRLAKEQHFPILPVTFINTGKILPKVKWAIYSGTVEMASIAPEKRESQKSLERRRVQRRRSRVPR